MACSAKILPGSWEAPAAHMRAAHGNLADVAKVPCEKVGLQRGRPRGGAHAEMEPRNCKKRTSPLFTSMTLHRP